MKKSLSLIISAGKGCFTCCKGCYQYCGKGNIKTKDITEFISKYRNHFALDKVTLAGGDPLTRKDIIHLINEISNMGLKINLDTVGKNLVKDSKLTFHGSALIKKIDINNLCDKVDMIGIPLDGCTTSQINSFRTMITIEEILEILNLLDSYNLNVCINTVVNKTNIKYLYEIFLKIKNYKNIKKWQLFQYSPIGELGYLNRELFKISSEEFNNSIEELINKVDDSKIQIQAKSNDLRKCAYILINSDGKVWYPNVDLDEIIFSKKDENPFNKVIGTIYDEDIFDKIDNEFENIYKRRVKEQI